MAEKKQLTRGAFKAMSPEDKEAILDRLQQTADVMNLLDDDAPARVVVCDRCRAPYIMVGAGRQDPDDCPDCNPA